MKKYNSVSYTLDKTENIEFIVCNHSTLSYPLHNHISVFIIGMILDGAITFTINDKIQIYGTGSTFVIPPYLPHSIQAVDPYTMLSICIHKKAVESMEYNELATKITHMLNDLTTLKKTSQNDILYLLQKILLFNGTLSTPKTILVNHLKTQLEMFPEKKISVAEMADAAFISKYHFIRNFKQEVGLTPHQFQLQNRIRKAQRLLNTTKTITEVAMNTGFYDQSHFIKHFEKIVGLTPSAYKLCYNTLKTDGFY